MDERELLQRYAAGPGAPAPVNLDVAPAVLATLRTARRDEWVAAPVRPLVWAAVASVLIALPVGWAAQQRWSDVQDPLASLVSPFDVSLQ